MGVRSDTGEVELVIELPPKRGIGARLARALRAAAAGSLVPAQTLARRVTVGEVPRRGHPSSGGSNRVSAVAAQTEEVGDEGGDFGGTFEDE